MASVLVDDNVLVLLGSEVLRALRGGQEVVVEVVIGSHGDREERIGDQLVGGGRADEVDDLTLGVLEVRELLVHGDHLDLQCKANNHRTVSDNLFSASESIHPC